MDFFVRQDQARRNTKWLILYFVLAVMGITLAIYLVFAGVFLRGQGGSGNDLIERWWDWQIFAGVAMGTLTVVLIGSLTKTMQLRGGGGAVATQLGGRLLGPSPSDPDEIKLRNVVEEMAIASGVPTPEIYVLDNEQAINAFAAGQSPQDAAVGVTRGCMQLLSRDELQGVIAHEFSHILNGDMRLNLRLIGLVHGILCITIIGRVLLYSGYRRRHHYYHLGARSRGKGGNPLPLIGIALMVIGGIGVFFGRLIKSAVSRQREFLADASAVQFTRNPGGIGGALKKIGGLSHGSRLQSDRAEEASHMFFGNGLAKSWFSMMATHPPLEERIRAIEPQFDGRFPEVKLQPRELEPARVISKAAATDHRSTVPPPRAADLLGSNLAPSRQAQVPPVIRAESVAADVGQLRSQHLQFAVELMAILPEPITRAVNESTGAAALLFGLLMSHEPQVRDRQLEIIRSQWQPFLADEVNRLQPHIDTLERHARLPIVDLALPALRSLSPHQYDDFCRVVKRLIEADRQIELFEYTLQKIIHRHLDPVFGRGAKTVAQYYSLKPLLGDCAVVLSALARAGHDEPDAVQSAFRHGAARLGAVKESPGLQFQANALEHLDAALDRLNQAVPLIKKRVLDACAHTVAADDIVSPDEAELLRAIADTLECPIPPFVGR